MFTGIVHGRFKVASLQKSIGLLRYAVNLPDSLLKGLDIGASVSIDGICQTVVQLDDTGVWFEAIQETLLKTTLQSISEGDLVNVERSARWGDEIGGHLLSGHVIGTAKITQIENLNEQKILHLSCPQEWMKYFFRKGFIALNGASLTLVDIFEHGEFTVHLIPETLRITTLDLKSVGDLINVEIDSRTQIIVDTIDRMRINPAVQLSTVGEN
jgi:riboflavin synthase